MLKMISFDLWDTIIKRKCHPEEIKLFTIRYMFLKYNNAIKEEYKDIYKILTLRNNIESEIAEENEKLGFDRECRILDVFDRLQNNIFKDKIDSISQELLKVEINHEKDMIYINPDILPIFEKYKDLRKCIISDFYMSAQSLKELLDFVHVNINFEKIYSSADELLNKRSGRLYTKVEKELGIKPEEHIHVGDNVFSDIEMAKKLGIQTIQIERNDVFEFSCSRNRKFNFNLDELKIKDITKQSDKLYNLGIEMAPFLYFFIQDIINHAIINKIDKVHYLTREGETFIKLHQYIKNNSTFGFDIPECEILEVSRMATFAASLKDFSIGELLRLWSQYRGQSLKALFKSLNIDMKKYQKYIDKYDIDPEKFEYEPWFNMKFQLLFQDEEFASKMNEEIKLKKNSLINFFESKKIYNDNNPLFVVDIGWRGTIQDNLAHIFKNKQIDGYYYTLFDFYNVQPKNSNKFSFVKDNNFRDDVFSSLITLFEMLFNPDTGSVVEYNNGKAIRKSKENEVKIVTEYTSYIQKGMLEGSKKINEYLFIHPYEMSEFYEYTLNEIKKVKTKPNIELLNVYYRLVHNDTFGTGSYMEKSSKLRKVDKINPIKVRNKLREEGWKEAFLEYNNLFFMDKIIKKTINIKYKLRKILKK
ncbi:MAG: HAD-IA family hydrolase [Clostridia bacterium]